MTVEDRGDGWTVGEDGSSTLDTAALEAMARAIAAEEFKKIGIIVIARGGRLLYEEVFDGSEIDTLRDTRSAAKTITGTLVGLAIDRGLLPGVDAPILPFFTDRMPLRNPHPRKD